MCMRPYLHYSSRSLLCHVVDSVLVSQPIRSLHCVVEMPPPVIILHVSQSCVDPTLWTRLIFNNSVKLNRHCTIVDYIYMKLCICIANHYCEFVKSQCNERIRNLAWWNAAEKTQNIQNNACPEWTYKKRVVIPVQQQCETWWGRAWWCRQCWSQPLTGQKLLWVQLLQLLPLQHQTHDPQPGTA